MERGLIRKNKRNTRRH